MQIFVAICCSPKKWHQQQNTIRQKALIKLDIDIIKMDIYAQNSPQELFPPINHVEPQMQQPQAQLIEQVQPQTPFSHLTLLESKKNMVKFIQSLQQFRKSELRTDVLAHCAQLNKPKKVIYNYISDETVQRMVSSRIDKMVKSKKIKKNWSQQDLKILVWTVSKYADLHNLQDLQKELTQDDWNRIAVLIPGVTATSCMFKWLSIRKTNLSVKHWTDLEANMLREIVEEQLTLPSMHLNTLNWKMISQKLYRGNPLSNKVFRSAKQCREHWTCYLNPHLKKGLWELNQDIQLLELIRSNNGQRKWAEIVYFFQGRTENALKNRYTLLIEKQKKCSKSKQEKYLIQDCLARCKRQFSKRTGEFKSKFINHVLTEVRTQENKEDIQYFSYEEKEADVQENRGDTRSQTSYESPEPQPPIRIKICKADHLDFLRQMALSREVKPGCIYNNIFKPQQ